MITPAKFLYGENRIFISGKAGSLEALTVTPSTERLPTSTAVICHPHPLFGGTMDNKVVSTIAKAFQNCGIRTVRFNFRGVGKSAGGFGEGIGEQGDLLAVLAWLRTERSSDQIWLAGFSFGAYIAFEVSKRWAIEQLILIAPPVQHFNFRQTSGFRTPVLLLQGEADDIVPADQVFGWAKKQTFPVQIIRFPGVGHFFHRALAELRLNLEAYIRKSHKRI